MAEVDMAEVNDANRQTSERLIEKICNCQTAHFKSQQLDEPDLTLKEKREIVADILSKGPTLFLRRFHQFLDESDVKYFEQFRNEYEVNFYLKEIVERSSSTRTRSGGLTAVVKCRRYAALQKLVKGGKYFCDHEMRKRNPQMFEQFVGQYMSRSEKEEMDLNAKRDDEDLRLSNVLMNCFEERNADLNNSSEEFDSSSDDDFGVDRLKEPLDECERHLLKSEFVSNMHRSFLEGQDAGFDYRDVDENADYDPLEVVQQDAEDRYFDSEESAAANSSDN